MHQIGLISRYILKALLPSALPTITPLSPHIRDGLLGRGSVWVISHALSVEIRSWFRLRPEPGRSMKYALKIS